MRSVIISDFGSVNGGAAKVAIESARGLAESGIDVVFACAIGPVSDRLDHPRIAVERFDGEEVWKVGRIAAARQGVWNAPAHAFLTGLLARQPKAATLVHLHQWTKAFSPAAIMAAAESGLPVALTLHDYFSFCPTGGYFDFKAGAPCRHKPMSVGCITANCDRASYIHKLVRIARQSRSDEALRLLRDPLFIHVSNFAREFAEPFLPSASRHAVVENMAEAVRHPPADVAGNRHALFLGRFTQEKGVLMLARAAAAAEMPLRLVGEGDKAIKREIVRLNPAAEIADWVTAEGAVAELRSARCLVAPSIWYETGPMSVPEAMALGVPVVLARQMGASGRVANGRSGLVFETGDEAGLVAALRETVDKGTVARLGLNAHADYWADPLTLQRHVERLAGAYRGLLAEDRAAA
jgi:glycosyltransferase involved in cell wall biosynthesis